MLPYVGKLGTRVVNMPDPQTGATQRPALRRRKLSLHVYGILLALLGVILIVTVLPQYVPAASVVYSPDVIRIVYFAVSAIVCILIFGLIGESSALAQYDGQNGLLIQLSGAAAALAIFYYLLSSGLSPYTQMTVSLLKDGQLLSDDQVEISLLSLPTQSVTTSSGVAVFSYLPKELQQITTTVRSKAGRSWSIKSAYPASCFDLSTNAAHTNCQQLQLTLASESICLRDQLISTNDESEINTNLNIIVPRFAENISSMSSDLHVTTKFSDVILAKNAHQIFFKMQRKSTAQRAVCDQLSEIAGWFNRSQGKNVVKMYASCTGVYVYSVDEPAPDGATSCD